MGPRRGFAPFTAADKDVVSSNVDSVYSTRFSILSRVPRSSLSPTRAAGTTR